MILDVGLPDGSGFEACRELGRNSSVPVLFLTARGEEIDRVPGLELGTDDFVTKPFSPRELAARVKATLRRKDELELRILVTDGSGVVTYDYDGTDKAKDYSR